MSEINLIAPEDAEVVYQEIDHNLTLIRQGFIKTSLSGEETETRSLEEARDILHVLGQLYKMGWELVDEYPSLLGQLEKFYGPWQELYLRDCLSETAFIEQYLFPATEQMPIVVDGQFDKTILQGYPEFFSNWREDTKQKHLSTQEVLKEKFTLNLNQGDMSCQCVQCLADYRTKVREVVVKQQIDMIDNAEERLYEICLVRNLTDVSNEVFQLKKNLEKKLFQFKNKFKRSSLNKIESEIKAHFKLKFSTSSPLGRVYREKLMAYFNGLVVEQGYKPELVNPEEYDRFFLQLETNIWRPDAYLRKEFERFIKSILTLKRKDISATILKDYLGQFWLHTKARQIKRKIIYHMGPTNSGKTYHAIEALCQAKSGSYLAPLRLLASELYDTMNGKGVKTTLLTGEEVVEVKEATHFSSTIEMAKLHESFDCVVIDEIQMLSDPQRGWAWTRALVNMAAPEIHLCGDHSVLELVKQILALTGDELEVKEYKRMTELQVMPKQITLSDLEKGDALIVFSRRNALKYKADLENLDFKVSIVYGRLSPEVRREQARKFDQGETDIMVSTDAIAMGMNLPVQRIVFSALSKFIDEREQMLTPSEIKQISGRAGRYKRFPIGYVTTLTKVDGGIEIVNEAIASTLGQSGKAMVGPDLEIFKSVNFALEQNSLPILSLSEFLRLFNTMIFVKPFYCTDLKEMIELAEMVEQADEQNILEASEIFGFACAPVNLGLVEHVQYYLWILNGYVNTEAIYCEEINSDSDDIDYLETAIKCVELYQWLSRHFAQKNFDFDEEKLLENKGFAVEKLNALLSEKITKTCSSCGCKLPANTRFPICDACFAKRRNQMRSQRGNQSSQEGSHQEGGGRSRSFKSTRNNGPGSGSGQSGSNGGSGIARRSDRRSGSISGGGSSKTSNAAKAFKKFR